MLISELIVKLQHIQEADGDREVAVFNNDQSGWDLREPELRKHFLRPESEDNYSVVIG